MGTAQCAAGGPQPQSTGDRVRRRSLTYQTVGARTILKDELLKPLLLGGRGASGGLWASGGRGREKGLEGLAHNRPLGLTRPPKSVFHEQCSRHVKRGAGVVRKVHTPTPCHCSGGGGGLRAGWL